MQNVYSPHSIRTKYFILRAKHFMNLVISLGWAELWGKVKKADLIGLNVLMKHILFFLSSSVLFLPSTLHWYGVWNARHMYQSRNIDDSQL